MNDKKKNSNSEDGPFSDSMELFDDIFSEVESDDDAKAKKKISYPVKPPAKTVPKKVPPKAEERLEPPKKPVAKKTVPPDAPIRSQPPVKKAAPIEKTEPPAAPSVKTVPQKVAQKAEQKVEPQKILSTKEAFPVTPTIVKPTVEKPKKGLNPFIFAISIVMLVILSMFTGKVMDYDSIMDFLKIRSFLAPEDETVPYESINERATSVVEVIKDVEKPKIEDLDIQTQEIDITKEKEDTPAPAVPPLVEKAADESADIIKSEILLSYPYSIYLGSYSNDIGVKEASSDYEKIGLSPYWIKIDLGEKGVWYRLFAGYFQTRREADEFINTRQIQGADTRLTKYANLIGIYSSQEEIEKQKAILEELGYSPYVISDTENVFRLCVGAFYQKDRAEEQNSDMALNGIQSQIVER